MASGIGVNPECLEAYQELKLGRKLKYVVFSLNKDNTEIVVAKKASIADLGDAPYDTFLADLPEAECRWAVYDLEFEKEGAGRRNKLLFYSWSPDEAKIKSKMVYASSKDALRRSLVGIALEIQGTAPDEVVYETVLEKASKGA